MIIKESILIRSPLETVWAVFSDIDNWAAWNPVCRECRFEQGTAIQEGACISFALNPLVVPMRIAPVVNRCIPGKMVTWAGRKWGIHAEHTFRFQHTGGETLLESEEVFSGPMLLPARLLGVPGRLHALTRDMLAAVKKEAEAR